MTRPGDDVDPLATVLLLTRNGERLLDEVVSAVRAQQTRLRVDVRAVDSSSSDATRDILARHGVPVTSIAAADFQHGRTRNLAAGLADGDSDYLVFLTQDATPRPGWLDALIRAVAESEDVAGAFARQIPRPGADPLVARRMLEEWPQVGGTRRIVKRWSPPADASSAAIPHELAHFANTSSCLRRSVWLHHPFPEVDFAEDVAWARQVLAAGYAIVYEPRAAVWHSHEGSLWRTFRENVDHARGVRAALEAPATMPPRHGALARVRRDLRWLWSGDRTLRARLYWTLRAPLWYVASTAGQQVGARGAHLPRRVLRALSWQAALGRERRAAP